MRLSIPIAAASISLAAVGAVTLSACGGSEPDRSGGPEVIATTGILAEIARNVAGDRVTVEQMIPNGASPHDFQLSARDRQRLEQADLVVENGAGLEAGIPLDDLDSPRWTLTDQVGDLLAFEGGGGDPHVWMDPTRVAAALPSLAAALGDAAPESRPLFERNARRYAARLRAADRRIRAALAAVAPGDRELVTSHDSLGYLADRYGLDVVATAFPASGAESEASADHLDQLADAIEASGVATVFAGQEDDPETLRAVADEAGVRVEDGLSIESPGAATTYERMLRHDAELIAAGLVR